MELKRECYGCLQYMEEKCEGKPKRYPATKETCLEFLQANRNQIIIAAIKSIDDVEKKELEWDEASEAFDRDPENEDLKKAEFAASEASDRSFERYTNICCIAMRKHRIYTTPSSRKAEKYVLETYELPYRG